MITGFTHKEYNGIFIMRVVIMKIAENTITEAMAEDAIILVGRCLKEIGTILTIILRQSVVGK